MSSFFVFKQKTAEAMRISDWSSDVCSSGLASRPRGVGESDTLANCGREHRRIVIGQCLGRLAGDDGARGASVEDEAGGELWTIDPRFAEKRQHLRGGPAVERRGV